MRHPKFRLPPDLACWYLLSHPGPHPAKLQVFVTAPEPQQCTCVFVHAETLTHVYADFNLTVQRTHTTLTHSYPYTCTYSHIHTHKYTHTHHIRSVTCTHMVIFTQITLYSIGHEKVMFACCHYEVYMNICLSINYVYWYVSFIALNQH